ncbi:MAG: hypothetical protein WBW33_29680, partial [Bryobacteraceae bacterium]
VYSPALALLTGTRCQNHAGDDGSELWLPKISWPLKIPNRFDQLFTPGVLQASAAELEYGAPAIAYASGP